MLKVSNVKNLVLLANHLDSLGLYKEADEIDNFLIKTAAPTTTATNYNTTRQQGATTNTYGAGQQDIKSSFMIYRNNGFNPSVFSDLTSRVFPAVTKFVNGAKKLKSAGIPANLLTTITKWYDFIKSKYPRLLKKSYLNNPSMEKSFIKEASKRKDLLDFSKVTKKDLNIIKKSSLYKQSDLASFVSRLTDPFGQAQMQAAEGGNVSGVAQSGVGSLVTSGEIGAAGGSETSFLAKWLSQIPGIGRYAPIISKGIDYIAVIVDVYQAIVELVAALNQRSKIEEMARSLGLDWMSCLTKNAMQYLGKNCVDSVDELRTEVLYYLQQRNTLQSRGGGTKYRTLFIKTGYLNAACINFYQNVVGVIINSVKAFADYFITIGAAQVAAGAAAVAATGGVVGGGVGGVAAGAETGPGAVATGGVGAVGGGVAAGVLGFAAGIAAGAFASWFLGLIMDEVRKGAVSKLTTSYSQLDIFLFKTMETINQEVLQKTKLTQQRSSALAGANTSKPNAG